MGRLLRQTGQHLTSLVRLTRPAGNMSEDELTLIDLAMGSGTLASATCRWPLKLLCARRPISEFESLASTEMATMPELRRIDVNPTSAPATVLPQQGVRRA